MLYRQAENNEAMIFELSREGNRGYISDAPFGVLPDIPKSLLRDSPPILPELTELDVVRHFVKLSQENYGVDIGFYPLGSCTMKYNPKLHEEIAASIDVTSHHPLDPEAFIQGNLELLWRFSQILCDISGMHEVTLQPAAGAQAEFLGAMIISKYHENNGDYRDEMLVPDTAHGTNPASSSMAGFRVVEIPSDDYGHVDIDALAAAASKKVAGLMLTNPNTLGIFESKIGEISSIIHEAGGLLYLDGANLNAILGQARPGDMGFDIVHFNMHKTFSTPHGGGGPGAGAIGVKSFLRDFLPIPRIFKDGEHYTILHGAPYSIGKLQSYYGNFAVLIRAYIYLISLGTDISSVSEMAVLNANYLMNRLKKEFDIPYIDNTPLRKHEFVISCEKIHKDTGVTVMDIARRMLDYGVHPPTVYFPLVVREALMIEPTETETKEALDNFADILIKIKKECYEQPELVLGAPHNTTRRKLDMVKATRNPVLSWKMLKD